MATARKNKVEKTRMVEEKYTEVTGIVLELDQDEANMLAALLGFHTSGDSKQVMNVYRALKDQVHIYSLGVTKIDNKMSGMVQVNN